MTPRQRVETTLSHQTPDRVPFDLGGCGTTGVHVSVVYRLRQALGLDDPNEPVKVIEPYQMLGEIAPDLLDALGVDIVPLASEVTWFGFRNEGWKPWTLFDGTPVLVAEKFNTQPEPNGDILMYPEGDRSASPSGRMPAGGFYFDAIVRQPPLDTGSLDPTDNMVEFTPLSEEALTAFASEARRLEGTTDRAILANFGGTSFGSIAQVPAPWLKEPRGIRDVEEWYVSLATRPDYIRAVFEHQCEVGLLNLTRLHQAVGERVTAVFITGTDFGMQTGPFLSPRTYRELFKPFHRRLNDWIHSNTRWRTFIHSCGSIVAFLDDFVDAGFDILNPVQFSAAQMDPVTLKARYGKRIAFWGGGVDTQHTLPFGTPEEVRREVRERIQVLGTDGGFVFNPVHNVQPGTPAENVLAMVETLHETGRYQHP